MSYFKKIGRPTEDEQIVMYQIDSLIQKHQIPVSEIPECQTLEDLIEVKTLLDTYSFNKNSSVEEEEIEANSTIEKAQIQEVNKEAVIVENDISELKSNSIEETKMEAVPNDFIVEDYDPFSTQIIERTYNKEQVQDDSSTQNEVLNNELSKNADLKLEEEKSNLSDLSPATKRRAAEQTANTILSGYRKLIPQAFKWIAKFPEDKIDKMTMSGELDVSIEVEQGKTFEQYMRECNEQLDEIFEVDDETIAEIKEPLVEVLMEQQLELTPQQRLSMAVLSHLVQLFTVSIKLRKQNQRILSYQQHLTLLSRGGVPQKS